MAKRRKAASVTLTPEQRQRLERLWFIYGNYGPKTTPGNHSFIQGLLEQGLDLRPLITKRSRKSEIPTPECEAAVDAVLVPENTAGVTDLRGTAGALRMISGTTQRQGAPPDPEWKAMLDDMRRRPRGARGQFTRDDGTPDAA